MADFEARYDRLCAMLEDFIQALRNDRRMVVADALETEFYRVVGRREVAPAADADAIERETFAVLGAPDASPRKRWCDLTGQVCEVTVRGRVDYIEVTEVPQDRDDC